MLAALQRKYVDVINLSSGLDPAEGRAHAPAARCSARSAGTHTFMLASFIRCVRLALSTATIGTFLCTSELFFIHKHAITHDQRGS